MYRARIIYLCSTDISTMFGRWLKIAYPILGTRHIYVSQGHEVIYEAGRMSNDSLFL